MVADTLERTAGTRLRIRRELEDIPPSLVKVQTSPARLRGLIEEYKKAGYRVSGIKRKPVLVTGWGPVVSFIVSPMRKAQAKTA